MTEITKEQQDKYIIEALGIAGFEHFGERIYTKDIEDYKAVVDLSAGTNIYFKDGKNIVKVGDDASGVLASIKMMVDEAKNGIMPAQTEADMQYSKDEVPTPQAKEPTPSPEVTAPSEVPAAGIPATPPEPEGSAPHAPIKQHQPPTQEQNAGLLDLIQKYVGNDVLQIFGETGAGKSKFCLETARQAIAAGKKVYYLDTERNLTDDDVASLTGCTYKYTPVLEEIDQIVQKLPAVDVVILDSIGFPVLTTYARLSLKQKGDALLKLIAIFGDLKTWAYKNNGVAIVTNQPESEFNKAPGHVFRPFGDKSQFACKEIWKTKIKTRGSTETNIQIDAFRSRSVGFGTKIATMKITDTGVEVVT